MVNHQHLQTKNILKVLDYIRGAAAVYVCLNHAIFALSSLYPGPRLDRPWWVWAYAFLLVSIRYASQAVILFFVLSGVVIHLRLATSKKSENFYYRNYFKKRFWRIYPPLVSALIFTLLIDSLGKTLNPAQYIGSDLSISAFLGNLLFLQKLVVPSYGSNDPLWSLTYEAIFYILYALCFVPIYLSKGKTIALLAGFSIGTFGLIMYLATSLYIWSLLAYFLIWLLGVVVAELFATKWTPQVQKNTLWIALLVALGVLVANYEEIYARSLATLYTFLWAITLAIFLLMIITEQKTIWAKALQRFLNLFAFATPFSYTLYLFHLPIITFGVALFTLYQPQRPNHPWWAILVAVISILISSIIGHKVERIGRTNSKDTV